MQKIYRSKTHTMFGGVCGGIGEYFGIDPVLVRLFFVLMAIFGGGFGILLYLVLLFVIPANPEPGNNATIAAEPGQQADAAAKTPEENQRQISFFVGVALVLFGGILLIKNLDFPWLHWLNHAFWPLILIAAGTAMLLYRVKGE